jgi:hypothetical protein
MIFRMIPHAAIEERQGGVLGYGEGMDEEVSCGVARWMNVHTFTGGQVRMKGKAGV